MKTVFLTLALISTVAQAGPNIVQVGSYQIIDDGINVRVTQTGTPQSNHNIGANITNIGHSSTKGNFSGMNIIRAPNASYLVQTVGSTTTVIQTSGSR